jgi:hypothetical protein
VVILEFKPPGFSRLRLSAGEIRETAGTGDLFFDSDYFRPRPLGLPEGMDGINLSGERRSDKIKSR